MPVGDSPRHLCQHPASTPCVNSRSQHPASTPCVNTVLFPGPTTKEILNFLCSRGPLQRKSSISFVPGAHYKGNLQFPLFPGPTTKEIFNFLCSQGPLQRKSSISFVPWSHYKGNLQFPLFPKPTTKEICNFLCSQDTILRQHPASTARVHRCPKLTPVPNRRPTDLQPI